MMLSARCCKSAASTHSNFAGSCAESAGMRLTINAASSLATALCPKTGPGAPYLSLMSGVSCAILAVSAVLALTASMEDLGELASAGAALSARTAATAATCCVMNGM
jgi:hypothetical protein